MNFKPITYKINFETEITRGITVARLIFADGYYWFHILKTLYQDVNNEPKEYSLYGGHRYLLKNNYPASVERMNECIQFHYGNQIKITQV